MISTTKLDVETGDQMGNLVYEGFSKVKISSNAKEVFL
jgi:hypothetical protein